MPTERERRQIERVHADQQILRHAAAWLRRHRSRAEYAGLSRNEDALALAELLDVLATALPDVASGVRRQAVKSCRSLLGETMTLPATRRIRRRR